jgi:hypothetical protein
MTVRRWFFAVNELKLCQQNWHYLCNHLRSSQMRRTLLFLCALLVGQTAFGQTMTHEETAASVPVEIIDGAKTPDLIQDVTAWRLWLLSVTAEDSSKPEVATDRRHAFLKQAGVVDDDMVIADEVLAHFKADYASMMDRYNKQVNAGQNPSLEEFRAQRDALVQATQTSLSGQLAPASAGRLKNFIVGEKSRMKVAKEAQ